MSHFSSVLCKLSNIEILKQALQLQPEVLKVQEGEGISVRGYSDKRVVADLVAVLNGGYDIGFVTQGDEIYAVADWGYGSCSIEGERQELKHIWMNINKSYAQLEALELISKAKELGIAHMRVVVH